MYKHGLGTQEIERSSMSHMNDVIDISMYTFEAMPLAVTIGGDVVNVGRVITRTFFRDDSFSGISYYNVDYNLKTYYELSLNVIANVVVDHALPTCLSRLWLVYA